MVRDSPENAHHEITVHTASTAPPMATRTVGRMRPASALARLSTAANRRAPRPHPAPTTTAPLQQGGKQGGAQPTPAAADAAPPPAARVNGGGPAPAKRGGGAERGDER